MPEKPYPERTKALLVNLAFRLRMARKALRRARRDNLPVSALELARGMELEAWNSFQAAKQVAFEE